MAISEMLELVVDDMMTLKSDLNNYILAYENTYKTNHTQLYTLAVKNELPRWVYYNQLLATDHENVWTDDGLYDSLLRSLAPALMVTKSLKLMKALKPSATLPELKEIWSGDYSMCETNTINFITTLDSLVSGLSALVQNKTSESESIHRDLLLIINMTPNITDCMFTYENSLYSLRDEVDQVLNDIQDWNLTKGDTIDLDEIMAKEMNLLDKNITLFDTLKSQYSRNEIYKLDLMADLSEDTVDAMNLFLDHIITRTYDEGQEHFKTVHFSPGFEG